MRSPLRCFWVGVVLLSLAPSTLTFSSGAGHTSCGEMIPGHIRSHPREGGREHIALRASASSYLPGQLVTVTVRSSRDFMGFLLQARRVESARKGVGPRRGGPGLVSGSWTFAPPGTHTLRCLSEGDTLTHSDKQLKRNLSFVWRAPDAPAGDIRFYITVVQSYFLYWASIESAVVRDGSRGPRTGSNITGDDARNYAQQEKEVTPLPASNKEMNQRARPAATLGAPTPTSSVEQSYRPQETQTEASRPVWEVNPLTNQAVNKRKKSSIIWGFNQNATKGSRKDTYTTVSHVSEEAESTHQVLEGVETGTDILSNITSPLFLLQPNASLLPLMEGEIERNSKDLILPNVPETTVNSSRTNVPSTNHGFHNTKSTIHDPSQNRRETIPDQSISVKFLNQSSFLQPWRITKSQMSLIKNEKGHHFVSQLQNLQLEPSPHPETSSVEPILHSPTGPSQTSAFFREPLSMSRTSPPHIFPSNTLILQPMSSLPHPEKSRPTTQFRQTTASPLSRPSPPQPVSFTQVMTQTIPTLTHSQTSYTQTEHSKSVPTAEALSISPQPWSLQWFRPPSQTADPQVHTFGRKPTQTSATLRSINLLHLTSRVRLGEDKKVKGPLSQAKLESSASPSRLGSTSFSSSHGWHASSLVPPTTPMYLSEGSAPLSIRTFFHHDSLSSLPFPTSMKNLPETAPALISLPSPSPISIPRHSPAQPSSTSPLPSSLTSSTVGPSNSSDYPSLLPMIASAPLSTSSSFPFTSSQTITGSANSLASFPTISPALISYSMSSSTSSISSPPSPPSYYPSIASSTSTSSSSSNLFATFSSSWSTGPQPEPSPAPRRSFYNPLASFTPSLVPPQQLTPGHWMPIQNHIESSNAGTNSDLPTPRTAVHPNLNSNLGPKLKPNLPKTGPEPKPPPKPPRTPDKKHPDVPPRHSAWELSMLLGCSVGLGTVLVVLVRYTCRQACGKQTQLTLNDRETEYGRGERGLLHLPEGGDLVRVRRIRENSFVLLAEYDVLASPGN